MISLVLFFWAVWGFCACICCGKRVVLHGGKAWTFVFAFACGPLVWLLMGLAWIAISRSEPEPEPESLEGAQAVSGATIGRASDKRFHLCRRNGVPKRGLNTGPVPVALGSCAARKQEALVS